MMSSNKNNFSAADIERYHSGSMSAGERHALEKAALDDPFLADALEGYAFTTTPQADLLSLKERLQEKTHSARVVPFFRRYRWISAAAVLVLVAGTALVFYNRSSQQNSSVAVQQQNLPSQKQNTPEIKTPFSTADSSGSHSIVFNDKKEIPELNRNTAGKKVDHQLTPLPLPTSNATRSNSVVEETIVSQKDQQVNSNLRSRRVNSTPYQNAEVNAPVQNNNARPYVSPNLSANDKFNSMRTSDSQRSDVALKLRENADTVRNLSIVLQQLKLDSSQVVTIDKSMEKKALTKYPRVIIDTLEPAGGFVKFDDYVTANLKMPEELQSKQASGEVELSFDVDKDGQPTNITVVKSLCEKCDEEAIRLLKEGPKWKKKRNKKGKITIKF